VENNWPEADMIVGGNLRIDRRESAETKGKRVLDNIHHLLPATSIRLKP